MKIAVLGSGNGGCAIAYDNAYHGHETRLWSSGTKPGYIEQIAARGGIQSDNLLPGFVELDYIGRDIERTIEDADLIYVAGTAYALRPYADAVRPHLREGQRFIVCPGSWGGALLFKQYLNLDRLDRSIVVGETSTLPYATRNVEPGRIVINHILQGGLYLATLPSDQVDELLELVKDVYPAMEASPNVLKTMLQNSNPVIHPPITLCNAARIDAQDDFFFYHEGVTPRVGNLIKAVDDERILLADALGVTILNDPELGVLQGYHIEGTYDGAYTTAPGYARAKSEGTVDHRYFNEDVGVGLYLMSELGDRLDVDTPHIDSMITVVSALMDRDYRATPARSLSDYGLDAIPTREWAGAL